VAPDPAAAGRSAPPLTVGAVEDGAGSADARRAAAPGHREDRAMTRRGRTAVGIAVLAATCALASTACAAGPGTTYAAQRVRFDDPLTGRPVWRLTTDGARAGALHLAAGDQSSESRSFSPDSARIVYAKSGMAPAKPDGVYAMDLATGVETFLAPAPWFAAPVFALDGSGEVYFYARPEGGPLRLQAVDTASYAVRTVVGLGRAPWQEKIEVNADGSLIAVHPRLEDRSYRTVIVTPRGEVLPHWGLDGPVSDDGAVWHPADPEWLCAVRGGEGRVWHARSLATRRPPCHPAHSAWHPGGRWWFEPAHLIDVETATPVLPGTGMEPIHPNFNPAERDRGPDARLVADDRRSFAGGTGCPRLYVGTVAAVMAAVRAGNFRLADLLVAAHYGSMERNLAHAHPHWSFDGRAILWTSDTRDLRDGRPPGPTGRGTDLFLLPMEPARPTAGPAPPPCPRP
jgi:hypothetical protein